MRGTSPMKLARRPVAIGAADPNWAGAAAAALDAAGIDVIEIVPEPNGLQETDAAVVVLAFDVDGLRMGVELCNVSVSVLAVGPKDMDLTIELLEVGALGYVDAEAGFGEIVAAVEQLLDGHAVVPPAALGTLLRRVVERRRSQRAEMERLDELTVREREVLDLVAAGLTNDAIAERLYISAGTARTHLQRVFRKLDVHTRADAVTFAARCGLDIGRGQ